MSLVTQYTPNSMDLSIVASEHANCHLWGLEAKSIAFVAPKMAAQIAKHIPRRTKSELLVRGWKEDPDYGYGEWYKLFKHNEGLSLYKQECDWWSVVLHPAGARNRILTYCWFHIPVVFPTVSLAAQIAEECYLHFDPSSLLHWEPVW